MIHHRTLDFLARLVGLCALLAVPTVGGVAKIVTEKDPVTGEIRMRSVPSEEDASTVGPGSQVGAPRNQTASRRTASSQGVTGSESAISPHRQFLLVAGLVLSVVGGFWLLVRMAQESVFWLIAGLLINAIAILVFLFVHPREAKAPFILSVIGWIVLYLGLRG